ncbi:alanine dehydrogenase [Pseudooceanicola sp.]|uniref:alanine dehydrogenase n=1 Tax=Pseudooceanicola sp. TaxID=1914328 RepID=UPI0026237969|nr:alanine dehydrogenase [Pseudooceanicola sp.]MDF1854336.1 alanine dehydrogenase [Pseudooceanicola sp.]
MHIGCPKEIKTHEYRVGLTPESASELVAHGHQVMIETGAGDGIGASDDQYRAAGATIADSAAALFAAADMVIKVKEPLAAERAMLRPGQILFTYLHLAADPDQTRDLVNSGASCVAYETVTGANGGLPLLKPMSQVAGRMAIQAGATALEKAHGGRGVLLGGVPGIAPGRVVVIGGGVVGFNAAQMAAGLGADVTVLDRSAEALERIDHLYHGRIRTLYSTRTVLAEAVAQADLVIGAVLIPGAAAPKLVNRALLATMNPGAVVVDVAIDQGGCFETSRPTTHDAPTFVEEGVVHYCVANMPGAVARSSTYALNNATLPHALALADHGLSVALTRDPHLRAGLNIHNGQVTFEAVARDLGYDYHPPEEALKTPA